ncbi:MAG: hypothetical protein H6840_10810 [Planctomycetes bacterium]|nr:hypothetical protein [Planctomycetota bacterium]
MPRNEKGNRMNRLLTAALAIVALSCALLDPEAPLQAADKPSKEHAELAEKVKSLLKTNCYGCHGEPGKKAKGKIDYILDHARLTSKLVNIKKPEKSKLLQVLDEGDMPRVPDPDGGKPVGKKLADDQIDLVRKWIEAGAPAWRATLVWEKVPDSMVPYTNLCEGPDDTILSISLRADGDKTWVYDYKEWKMLDASSPSSFACMAYDSKRKRTVAFDLDTQDTWEFSGGKWTKLTTRSKPEKRENAQVAFDAARGVVVLYGGMDKAGANLNDTWEYNGKDWIQKTTTAQPIAGAGCMAYDPRAKACVLHTGAGNETWTYDGKDWTRKQTANSPGARNYASACYDPIGERVLLYGGSKGGGVNHELWAFDGADWTLLETEGELSRQNGSFILAHASRKKLYHLCGGIWTANLK